MNREDFKIMSYGQFTYTNMSLPINKQELQSFVSGALFAYDFMQKKMKEEANAKMLLTETVNKDKHQAINEL